MAKVVITFDTNSKECELTIDGSTLADVAYVTVSKYDDMDSYIDIEVKPQDIDGMRVYNRISASNKIEDSSSIKEYASEDKSLALVNNKDAVQDKIRKYLLG